MQHPLTLGSACNSGHAGSCLSYDIMTTGGNAGVQERDQPHHDSYRCCSPRSWYVAPSFVGDSSLLGFLIRAQRHACLSSWHAKSVDAACNRFWVPCTAMVNKLSWHCTGWRCAVVPYRLDACTLLSCAALCLLLLPRPGLKLRSSCVRLNTPHSLHSNPSAINGSSGSGPDGRTASCQAGCQVTLGSPFT